MFAFDHQEQYKQAAENCQKTMRARYTDEELKVRWVSVVRKPNNRYRYLL